MEMKVTFSEESGTFAPEFGEVQIIDAGGVDSVTQTTTSTEDGGINIVTIALTNGEESTFQVRNGSRGSTGADGKDGQPGKDGYTPVKGVDYFDGADGKDGVDGKTPVKGVDYFTEADKAEIAAMVEIPEGDSAAIDATLTKEGHAADAKATGKAIAEKSQVQIITWEEND